MPKYKNIIIKKAGGGSRKQRVQVLRSGKYKFVKNLNSQGRSKKASPIRKVKKIKRRVLSMARRRVKKRGSSKGRMSKTGELFWMGAGAGLSGIAEQGANMLTKGALTGNLGAGVVGLALHKFSKGIPKKMGQGIMVKAIGDLVENNVAPKLFSVIGGSLNVSGNNSTKDDTVLA